MSELTPEQVAVVGVLRYGILDIRRAAAEGDAKKAFAIADALHRLPDLLVYENGSDLADRARIEIMLGERSPGELELWSNMLRPHAM